MLLDNIGLMKRLKGFGRVATCMGQEHARSARVSFKKVGNVINILVYYYPAAFSGGMESNFGSSYCKFG
jgi:hypothetical protein